MTSFALRTRQYQPRARFQPRCQRYGPFAARHGRLAACGCGSSGFRPRACSLPVPIKCARTHPSNPAASVTARSLPGTGDWRPAVAEALVFVRGLAAFQFQSNARALILPTPLTALQPVRCLARETGGLRLWKLSVRAPTTALHQSLFLKKYDILSSNYPANSPEYDFEKLKAFPDHSERSSNEGFMSTSATVIREIT